MPRSSPVQIYKVVKTADNKFNKNAYKKALEGYKRALKMSPTKEIESYCYLKIGLCYQYLQKYHDSIAAFDKSSSINKGFEPFYYKGLVLLRLKMYKESENTFKQILKLKSLNNNHEFLANLNLGRVSFLRGKLKNAIKYLNVAHKINNKDITTLLLKAETFKAVKKIEEAKQSFEKVLKLDVNNNDALLGIIEIILDNTGNKQQAIKYLSSHLKKMPKPGSNLFLLKGDIHFSLGDYENALINYKKVRQAGKKETKSKALNRQIRALLKLKKDDEAISILTEHLKNNKNDFQANLNLAEIYATKKNNEKASIILHTLINDTTELLQNPELSYAIANVLLLNEEDDKAEEYFLNAYNLGLKTWTIMKQLTLIYIASKNFPQASTFVDTSFKYASSTFEMVQSFHLKAIIQYEMGEYNNCIKICNNGIKELHSKEDQHFYLLSLLKAKSFFKLNEEKKAHSMVMEIIKGNPELQKIVKNDSDLKGLV